MMPRPPSNFVLVVGYGSTVRGDDGVGRWVAEIIGGQARPRVEVVSVTQLLPELAAAAARAWAVIFVDACCDDGVATVRVQELTAGAGSVGQTHFAQPADILRLSQACYGRSPRAWLVCVPTQRLGISGELSATARKHADVAVRIVGELIDAALGDCGGATLPLPEEEGSRPIVSPASAREVNHA